MNDWSCSSCSDEGRRGYCAPNRCYCGHESCHAYASWRPRRDPFENVSSLPTMSPDLWAERDENNWIDRM